MKKRRFSRTQLLRGHADKIYSIFALLGHKIDPSKMDQTIQKTLQNMRDKDWILFLGSYSGYRKNY